MEFSIRRSIGENSVDFNLTGIELDRAFNITQAIHDNDLACNCLKELEYERWNEIPEEILEKIKAEFRIEMEENAECIMKNAILNHKAELKEYEEKWKVFSVEVTQTRKHTYTIRAKNEEDAERIFENWYDHHETQVDYDFADEDADTDTSWFEEEENANPDYADIQVEG